MKNNNKIKFSCQQCGFSFLWFTLIEIMVWILIVSIILIWGFKAYSWILIWKIKLIESTNIQKQAFFFSEKFFEEVKRWWTIDYEEYFNRKVVWTTTGSWHYDKQTWFWNNWTESWFYYCRSNIWDWNKMTWTGCVTTFNNSSTSNQTWEKQKYWQYSFQFIDYNSNHDDDYWDEDWVWGIIWDDDDEYLWLWPSAFSWSEVKEIYLISADKKKRTFFRWNKFPDETKPSETRWTIEFLKLEWKDWWFNHQQSWTGLYDWIVDTWLIDKDFSWKTNLDKDNAIFAWSWTIDLYWQPLFWENINVKDFKVFAYPNKDKDLAWQDSDLKININPYLRIQMVLTPSYKAKWWFRWKIPDIKINTTINLTDIYSR